MERKRQNCGQRQTGGPRKGLARKLHRPLRALAFSEREKAETEDRVTGKEKSHRRGWPTHAASFPLYPRTLRFREGEADVGT